MGSYGEYNSVLARDFWRLNWSPADCFEMPRPVYHTLTLKYKDGNVHEKKHPFFLPTDYLHYMSKDSTVFCDILKGDRGEVEKYWASQQDLPDGRRHPFVDFPADQHHLGIPIRVHGDAVRCFQKESVLVLSIHGTLPYRHKRLTRLLLTVMPYSWMSSYTLRQIYTVIADDLNLAFDGACVTFPFHSIPFHVQSLPVAGQLCFVTLVNTICVFR